MVRHRRPETLNHRWRGRGFCHALFALGAPWVCATSHAQLDIDVSEGLNITENVTAPSKVNILPDAGDADIAQRLVKILDATNWFEDPGVRVDEGVVFLSGTAESAAHSEWASQLAASTQDVVAVVNHIALKTASPWDFSASFESLGQTFVHAAQATPAILLGGILLILTGALCAAIASVARRSLAGKVRSLLLRQVLARAIAIPVFLVGLYLVLQLSGLTSLALTVLGGTGIVGLIIGFGFRDIAENFLSSILISAQRPFAIGDLISVADHQGFVQRVTTRSTLLMTLEGNHVQIPNSSVYKGTIINYTTNPKSRASFSVGIGYADSIQTAQATAMQVLREHPAVVTDPKPMVLVDSLGPATVNLSIFFWVDITRNSQLRVLSAVIRLTKRAFERAGVSMPDEAREVVFPDGLPIDLPLGQQTPTNTSAAKVPLDTRDVELEITSSDRDDDRSVNDAEGNLEAESEDIYSQAAFSRVPEASGANLIADVDGSVEK